LRICPEIRKVKIRKRKNPENKNPEKQKSGKTPISLIVSINE